MILVEKHSIKRKPKTKELYKTIDDFCYKSKNLYNSANYLITQCSRISYKLKQGEILESWEKSLIYRVNCGIKAFNDNKGKKLMNYIDENNGFVANHFFLLPFLKDTFDYKEMPYAVSAQQCVIKLCQNWKAYYEGMKAYKKGNKNMLGRPKPPKYYDKNTGRNALIITGQQTEVENDGTIHIKPKFLEKLNLHFKVRYATKINQVRVVTKPNAIDFEIAYEVPDVKPKQKKNRVMGIDLGVDNLATLTSNTEMQPVIINGGPLKSINHYYNKKKAYLQETAKTMNDTFNTMRLYRLTDKRNNKVADCLHKASAKIIALAEKYDIDTIVIGNNKGWKQNVDMGKKTNQTFVSIPFHNLIQKIQYKAERLGIAVTVVEESYTSGTSYLDNEQPIQSNYNPQRRVSRGQFQSNTGVLINADVNASYQIMKKAKVNSPVYLNEKVTQLNVA